MVTTLTPAQHAEQTELIQVLFDAKCPDGKEVYSYGGMVGYSHSECCKSEDGTGLNPQFDLLRTGAGTHLCDYPIAHHDKGKCPERIHAAHVSGCSVTRPVSPEEAKALGLDLLEAMVGYTKLTHDSRGWEVFHFGSPKVGDERWHGTSLTAILRAMAAAVGVAVPEEEG